MASKSCNPKPPPPPAPFHGPIPKLKPSFIPTPTPTSLPPRPNSKPIKMKTIPVPVRSHAQDSDYNYNSNKVHKNVHRTAGNGSGSQKSKPRSSSGAASPIPIPPANYGHRSLSASASASPSHCTGSNNNNNCLYSSYRGYTNKYSNNSNGCNSNSNGHVDDLYSDRSADKRNGNLARLRVHEQDKVCDKERSNINATNTNAKVGGGHASNGNSNKVVYRETPTPTAAAGSLLPQRLQQQHQLHRRSLSVSSSSSFSPAASALPMSRQIYSTPPNMNLSFRIKPNQHHRNSTISTLISDSVPIRPEFMTPQPIRQKPYSEFDIAYDEPPPDSPTSPALLSYGFGALGPVTVNSFWQKSLSESNLQNISQVEMNRGPEHAKNVGASKNSKAVCAHCNNYAGGTLKSSKKSKSKHTSPISDSDYNYSLSVSPNSGTNDNDYAFGSVCTCAPNMPNGKSQKDRERGRSPTKNAAPKFFRSISLRNLLQIGGMNKSRQNPAQGKKVLPPTVPVTASLVSFASFRIKKNQQPPTHLQLDNKDPDSPRYSGSSLGSTGSSYNSAGSSSSTSSSGSSDNRSSIGTDDGFMLPAPNGYLLKDFEDPRLYASDELPLPPPPPQLVHHQHQSHSHSHGHLANSKSFDSFTTGITTVDMHQGMYGKIGGGTSNGVSSGCSSTPNGQTSSQYVTVHVDPYYNPASSNSSISSSNGSTISHGSSTLTSASSNSVASTNNHQAAVAAAAHNHHHHHNLHHHNHHHQHPHQHSPNIFSPSSQHSPLTNNAAAAGATGATNHYQTQISMEDQGIDMTQSPGRESPSSTASSNTGSGSGSAVGSVGSGSGSNSNGSGCGTSGSGGSRHSASSFDSGRASASTIYQGVRFSGLSSESSSGSFRHSYHSSNSSLGSIAPEDICNFDVGAMIAQGIPDHEVINAWLTGIHFECYYQSFIQAGYDMVTICRMTPEDLNAIGVTKPNHRKRLKSEISQLNIPDGLPEYIPGSIEEWLGVLKLDEYTTKLRAQGYHSVRQATTITWEDLEEIGILKLGHQKKFMLAIKRVEDILSGKRLQQQTNSPQYMENYPSRPMLNTSISSCSSNNSASASSSHHGAMPYSSPQQSMLQNSSASSTCSNNNNGTSNSYPFPRGPPQQHQIYRQSPNPNQFQPQQQVSSSSLYSCNNNTTITNNGTSPVGTILTHQPQLHHHPLSSNSSSPATATVPGTGTGTPQYQPEVISIQVKSGRRKSLENISAQEPIYGTSSFLPLQQQQQNGGPNSQAGWQRSGVKSNYDYDGGDTTPTNEFQGPGSLSPSSTSTLPRLIKNKPIAKIMGGGGLNSPAQQQAAVGDGSSNGLSYTPVQAPQVPYSDGYKSLPRDMGRLSKLGRTQSYSQASSGSHGMNNGGYNTMRAMKNGPPPPPRRVSGSASAGKNGIYGQLGSIRQGAASNYSPYDSQQLPPPPPALQSCGSALYSSSLNQSMDELPPPPPPDDMAPSQQSHGPQSLHPNHPPTGYPIKKNPIVVVNSHANAGNAHAHASSSTPYNHNTPSHYNSYNGPINPPSKLPMSTTSNGQYQNHHSQYNNNVNRSNTPTNRSRDPSPVGSDFSDADLPGSLISRGVRRNGSDASFKSNSSTESESIPFANDNAGTIKQQKPGNRSTAQLVANAASASAGKNPASAASSSSSSSGTGDVLSDIGNMLADLTDELDAILEQEIQSKRS